MFGALYMEIAMLILETVRRLLSRLGPYAIVEMVVPGGTLLALLLYWYRRRTRLETVVGTMSSRRPTDRLEGAVARTQ